MCSCEEKEKYHYISSCPLSHNLRRMIGEREKNLIKELWKLIILGNYNCLRHINNELFKTMIES